MGIAGWVYRVGNTVPTQLPRAEARRNPTSEAGPVTPAGGGVGGWGGLADPFACDIPGTSEPTPSGPGRYSPAPGRGLPGSPRAAGLGRDSMPYSLKLVKTTKCHRKVFKRPTLVPVCQNGSGKSPLEIPRFPFWLAFSCKELMGHFDPWTIVYCQNDEVSPVCTPMFRVAKGSVNTPCHDIVVSFLIDLSAVHN